MYTKNYLNSQVGADCYAYSYIAVRLNIISIFVALSEYMNLNKSRNRWISIKCIASKNVISIEIQEKMWEIWSNQIPLKPEI